MSIKNSKLKNSRKKYRRNKIKTKKKFIITFAVIFTFITFVFINNLTIYTMSQEFRNQNVNVEFENKENIYSIADKLYSKNIINNKLMFRLLAKLNDLHYIPKKSVHTFRRNYNMFQIISILKETADYDYKLVLYDGDSLGTLIDFFSNNSDEKDALVNKINDSNFINKLIDKYPMISREILTRDLRYRLEGFVYPGEYFIKKEDSIVKVIDEGISRFFKAYDSSNIKENIKDDPEKLFELLTLSSLVRGEVNPKDYINQRKVAGVFHNRLSNNMKLQSDVTVAYAIRNNKDNFTPEELSTCSLYNTYYVDGLPIGPVNNTNIKVIESTMSYIPSEHFYFLVDVYSEQGKANFHYAETYEEHMDNIQKYLSGNR